MVNLRMTEETVIFSMQTFVVKLASGIAVLVASISLSAFHISDTNKTLEAVDGSFIEGLKATIAEMAPVVVNSSSVFGLRLTMTLVPIFGLIIAIILFKLQYKLNDKKMGEIIAELKKRIRQKEFKPEQSEVNE